VPTGRLGKTKAPEASVFHLLSKRGGWVGDDDFAALNDGTGGILDRAGDGSEVGLCPRSGCGEEQSEG
jgi:hypothetical protein